MSRNREIANITQKDLTKEGVLTFTSSPIASTPTTDMQASTKLYADGKVSKSGDTMTGKLDFSGIDAQIGTSTNNALILKTNGTEKVRVDTSGNVGIGGTPTEKLSTGGGALIVGTGTRTDLSPNGLVIDYPSVGLGARIASLQANTSAYSDLQIAANYTQFVNGGFSRLVIDPSGNVLVTGSGGLGYGTGSGGTVTQLTSKSTAVTLNKPCGQIIMNNASLAAGASAAFLVVNNKVSPDDCINLMLQSGYANGQYYQLWTATSASGSFYIVVKNISTGALSEPVVINFSITKGAIA